MVSLQELLQYLGAVTALSATYTLSRFLYLYLRPSSLPRYHHKNPGKNWALITGSTQGIGTGFAQALLAKNFNILLHGRNKQKLDDLAADLGSQYPNLQVRTVVADAFDFDSDIKGIVKAAEELPGKLTILINNVGGAPLTPSFKPLSAQSDGDVDKLLNLNARFPAQLTRALLPLLNRNNPALVLNICSITGLRGLPYLTIYSSSKAFNYTFSQSLSTEMKAENIDIEILGIVVGNVLSGGNKTDYKGFTCSSLEMAEQSLARVGCGRGTVFGWWRHGFQWAMLSWLPDWVVEKEFIGVMRGRSEEEQKAA